MARRCPICTSVAEAHPTNRYAPFCSARCKRIDLGHWLSESYRIDEETPALPVHPRRGDEGRR